MIEEIEPGYFNYDSFDEMKRIYKSLFINKGITTLYKIRYWKEKHHKEFLTDGQIYFSKPSQLNDPFDINRPLELDISIIETPEFLQRLIYHAPAMFGVNPGRDAEIAAKNHLIENIRPNPKEFFLKAYESIVNDPENDNQLGIFSLTYDILNDNLWGYYGGGLKGYAVGFDPLKLTEVIFPFFGQLVTYDDNIRVSKILANSFKEVLDQWFTKFKRWKFESEFRFIGMITEEAPRFKYYPPEIVKEIILGPKIQKDDRTAIIEICKQKYLNAAILEVNCDYSKGNLYLRHL